MNEEWRSLPGYPGYEVSDQGRIRSYWTRGIGAHITTRAFRVLAQNLNKGGYARVTLHLDGKVVSRTVHQLVALAFVGPRPADHDVRHLDGNKLNPRPDNLAYGTRSQNIRDMVEHGTHNAASKTRCPSGHPYDEANTINRSNGKRDCRACKRAA